MQSLLINNKKLLSHFRNIKTRSPVTMKKQILLLTVVVLSITTMAQTKTSYGIRGGLTSSGMRGAAVNNLQNLLDFTDGAITPGKHTGFFGGGNVTISLNDNISIEPALYYAQKGYELKGALNIKGAEFIGANAKAQLTSHYIDLPVTLKANLGGFRFFAGPQISYLATADLRTTAGVLGFNVLDRKMDATEQLNRWDASVTGGVGYQFGNGFNVMAAYDHGLSKADANKNFDSYNNSFKIGVGINF
jgi:hypothetical protein